MGNHRTFGYRPVFSRGWRAGVTSAQKSKLITSFHLLFETSGQDYFYKKLKKQLAVQEGTLGSCEFLCHVTWLNRSHDLFSRQKHLNLWTSFTGLSSTIPEPFGVKMDYKMPYSHFLACVIGIYLWIPSSIYAFSHLLACSGDLVLFQKFLSCLPYRSVHPLTIKAGCSQFWCI